AALGVLQDLAAAMGAGDGRLIVPVVRPILILGVVDQPGIVVVPVAPAGHGQASSSAIPGASGAARPIRGDRASIVSRRLPACQTSRASAPLTAARTDEYTGRRCGRRPAREGPFGPGHGRPDVSIRARSGRFLLRRGSGEKGEASCSAVS